MNNTQKINQYVAMQFNKQLEQWKTQCYVQVAAAIMMKTSNMVKVSCIWWICKIEHFCNSACIIISVAVQWCIQMHSAENISDQLEDITYL